MADRQLKHVIGVDAGGSKTLALLVAETGEVVARSRSGGANVRSVGPDQATRAMREALEPLLRTQNIEAICLGAAGLARASDRDFFERVLREIAGPTPMVVLRNDAQIALEAGTSERPAIVAIAGTGAMVYGERADGSSVRCGGYGAVVGDLAGGYAIGVRALRHAARTLDGLAEPGPLSQAILTAVDAPDVPQLVDRIHRWPPEVGPIAALASLVADAASQHDAGAQAILHDACESMREQVERVAAQVRVRDPLRVVLYGGAFEAVAGLAAAAEEGAAATGPCVCGRPSVEPAHGAALIALDALGIIHLRP